MAKKRPKNPANLFDAEYKVGDTIKAGAYRGFVVTKVTRGWYHAYHPSNVCQCDVEAAVTKIRWSWV